MDAEPGHEGHSAGTLSVGAARGRRHFRRTLVAVAGAVLVILVASFVVVLDRFNSDRQRLRVVQPPLVAARNTFPGLDLRIKSLRSFLDQPAIGGNYIYIFADVLSVDAETHQMKIRLQFDPHGAYNQTINGNPSNRLTQRVGLISYNASGNLEQFFEAGQYMAPIDVTLPLSHQTSSDTNTANQVTSYPFDHYNTQLSVALSTGETDPAQRQHIVSVLDFVYAAHGFRIAASDATTVYPEFKYNLSIRRASSTMFFAIFVMVLMWALTLAVVAMALILTHLRHDIGPGVLGFLAALLFAFPNIRNALPGAPPLGSLNDYLSFFWCEGIVGVTLVVLTVLFLRRETETRSV
jgi:hypothetical protein